MRLAHSEKQPDGESTSRKAGIYLLPNLLTTSALFAGFYGIVAAINGNFGIAAIAILIAMFFDGIDGRVARLTNTQSEFGAQYDSLADMISFGLAPSLIMYEWALFKFGKIGWLIAFVYAASTALRLARFNANSGPSDNLTFFVGLPSPAAAAVIAASVWVGVGFGLQNSIGWSFFCAFTVAFTSLLMVSEVPYLTFKDIDLQGKVPFVAILSIVLIYVLVSLEPASILLFCFWGYLLSGVAKCLWDLSLRKVFDKKEIP